jgi:hypothetical protein
MSSFFKKALGIFVEFDEESKKSNSNSSNNPELSEEIFKNPSNHEEAQKFEVYFNNLFEKSNLPGPDYFEFYKMMETLEPHIADYKARLAATFASLSIQGLTKEKLIDTAIKYRLIVEVDRTNFEQILAVKLKTDVGQRRDQLGALEQKIKTNSEEIQRLTKEISDSQNMMGKVKMEVIELENKLNKNKNGYLVACQAVISKINSDIQKIQSAF